MQNGRGRKVRLRACSLLAAGALLAVVAAASASAHTPHPPRAVHRAAIVLSAAPHAPHLYNQNNNGGGVGIVSQNFEPAYDAYDSQGADDFKVPRGHTWTVTQISVTGSYFYGPGPADSETVTFFSDAAGAPGATVVSRTVVGSDPDGLGSFSIKLAGVTLPAGKYWVSVQANMSLESGGEWAWGTRLTQRGVHASMWQNPLDGFATGCTAWGDQQTCLGLQGEGPDFMFGLHGTST